MLEVLPQEIEALSVKIESIEKELFEDADLYGRDPKRFDELTADLKAAKEEKEFKENLWLEIQIKAEELSAI